MLYDIVAEDLPDYNIRKGNCFTDFDAKKEFEYQMNKYFPNIWKIEEISRRKGNHERIESLVKCSFIMANSSKHHFYIYLCPIEGGGRKDDEQRIQFRAHYAWNPDLNTLNIGENFYTSENADQKECYLIGIYKRSQEDHDVIFVGIHPNWLHERCIETTNVSPQSFQIKINAIQETYLHGKFIFVKGNSERAICFKPSKILWYMKNRDILHIKDLNEIINTSTNQNEDLCPKQIIYYGAPGTGKSHTVKKTTGEIDEENMEHKHLPNVFRTTFHPDSDYATFVGCYKPCMETNDTKKEIFYDFVPQTFTNAYIYAYTHPDEPTYLVIEEINRGNCAQIFGDLFQLLDRDENGVSEYAIKADTDVRTFLEEKLGVDKPGIKNGELRLPSNFYIYATMNTSDQSLFPIDSAFKRRWDWEYEPIKYENTNWMIDIQGEKYSWVSFQEEVNKRIFEATNSEDKQLGDYFVNPRNNIITEKILVNKILFYLWNDVCKDGDEDIFKVSDTENVSFSELYSDKEKLIKLMNYLDVEKYINDNKDQASENEEESDEETPTTPQSV